MNRKPPWSLIVEGGLCFVAAYWTFAAVVSGDWRRLLVALGAIAIAYGLSERRHRKQTLDAFQAAVNRCQEQTFPNSSLRSVMTHLLDELDELEATDYQEAEELADSFLLMLALAGKMGVSVWSEAQRKFAINRTRSWTSGVDEPYARHVED